MTMDIFLVNPWVLFLIIIFWVATFFFMACVEEDVKKMSDAEVKRFYKIYIILCVFVFILPYSLGVYFNIYDKFSPKGKECMASCMRR